MAALCDVNLIVERSTIPSQPRERSHLIPQLNQIICRLCVKEAPGRVGFCLMRQRFMTVILCICVCSKIKVWDLQAALDPRAPASTLCLRTLVVSILFK